MARVLLTGNGFDLAHQLPTSYSNFLYVMEHLSAIPSWVQSYRVNPMSFVNREIFREGLIIEDADIEKMVSLLQDNIWTNYYRNCGAQIQGWIDFENEMKPALQFWNYILNSDVETYSLNDGTKGRINVSEQWLLRQAQLWQKEFFDSVFQSDKFISIKSSYVQKQYGILSGNVIDKLLKELDDFTEAFCIYLSIFASCRGIEKHPQIEKINPNVIIDFNYTSTEQIYSNWTAETFHVHGGLESKNVVLGVNCEEGLADDFIPFQKYYQRIKKKCDIDFHRYTEGSEPVEVLSIYGCSMDKTDSDIITPLIKKSNRTDIYYYNTRDYNNKLINLVRLLDRKTMEQYTYTEKVCFVPIEG